MKKYMILLFCTVPLTFSLLNCAKKKTQNEAALDVLKSLKDLAAKDYKRTSFKSANEAKQSTLGDPMQVYMIGLQEIMQYKTTTKVQDILKKTDQVTYPVYSGSTMRSAVTIRKKGDTWKPVSLNSHSARLAEPIRVKQASQMKKNKEDYFIVLIPAMYFKFLGYYSDGNLYLIPLHKHPDVSFTPGRALPAKTIIAKIQPLAKKYSNYPKPNGM